MYAFGSDFHGIFPLMITIILKLNINNVHPKTAARTWSIAEMATDTDPI
jgi:hypothetical protein